MKIYGVIMAGGGGTRFWPLSRRRKPKQLLNLSGNDLMINETIERIHRFIDYENILIVTNIEQVSDMMNAVGEKIKQENILVEPTARNTSACIGYAAEVIEKRFGGGIMCVFPSDHHIENAEEFVRIVNLGIQEVIKRDCIMTIGIQPVFPATGYGYIKFTDEEGISKAVEQFVEKPDRERAEQYLVEGKYLWNSGMFIWKTVTILREIKNHIPEVFACIEQIGRSVGKTEEKDVIEQVYPVIPKISIDYGVMERSEIVRVIGGDFGWNDVGSWDMLEVLHGKDAQGNVSTGVHYGIDTKNSVIYGAGKKVVTTIGVEDIVVVDTEDALLVCKKDRVQDVKKMVDLLIESNHSELL